MFKWSSKKIRNDEIKEIYKRPDNELEIKSETNIKVIGSDATKQVDEQAQAVTKNVEDADDKAKQQTTEKSKEIGKDAKGYDNKLQKETANKVKAAKKGINDLGINAQKQTLDKAKQVSNNVKEIRSNAQKHIKVRVKAASEDLKPFGERLEKQAAMTTKNLGDEIERATKKKCKEIDKKLRVYEKNIEYTIKAYAIQVKEKSLKREKSIENHIRKGETRDIFTKYGKVEKDIENNLSLNDDECAERREDFVKKVNCLLGMQILFTAVIMAPFVFLDSKKEWAKENISILPFICVAMLVIYTILAVSKSAKQKPFSYILLLLLSILMGFVCGMISATHSKFLVLLSILMTAFALILMSFIMQIIQMDVTKYRSWLIVLSVWLCVCGIGFALYSTFNTVSYHHSFISGFASLFFVLAMWFDLQMLQGGHTLEIDEGDYVSGVVTLYVDIMFLFIHLLQIAGYFTR